MWTSKALPLATAALLALAGCATEPVEPGGPEGTSGQPDPFDREITPTETGDDDENVAPPEGQSLP